MIFWRCNMLDFFIDLSFLKVSSFFLLFHLILLFHLDIFYNFNLVLLIFSFINFFFILDLHCLFFIFNSFLDNSVYSLIKLLIIHSFAHCSFILCIIMFLCDFYFSDYFFPKLLITIIIKTYTLKHLFQLLVWSLLFLI